MAQKVFFHVGLPKTGTTYLQTLMWDNREELARQGVLLPGGSRRQHLWATGVVREDPDLDRRGPEAAHAWDRLVADINGWDGTAVVSHEFFAPATPGQVARATSALDGAEVHVVVTARDTLSLVTARWQEYVKNGATVPIDDYPPEQPSGPWDDWGWSSLDLADVLGRWGAVVRHDRVHVLTLPRSDEPAETLWLRFAALLGVDPSGCVTDGSRRNESLGVVEVELLRRLNADLDDFSSSSDRGSWIRGYLAEGKLLPRGGDRFWPSASRVAELRERGNRVVDAVGSAGYDVIGDLGDLRTPAELPERRHPDSVTEAELLDAASSVIAAMMDDVRRLTREKRALNARLREALAAARQPEVPRSRLMRPVRRTAGRVRRVWSRS